MQEALQSIRRHRLVEWLFDIPVRRGEDIDFWSGRLYRESEGRDGKRERAAASWNVQLAFDLPGLGPVQAQITLLGERVSTRFRVERPDTVPLFRQHLHELRRALLDAGVQVGDIDCRQGVIPPESQRPTNPLINEKV